MTIDALPSVMRDNAINGGGRNAVSGSQYLDGLFCGKMSDCSDLLNRNFVVRISHSSPTVDSSLANRISHVFSVCANPKMRRINTRGIISGRTIMEYPHAVRNRPKMDNPASTVSEDHFSGFVGREFSVTADGCARPQPTRVRHFDFGKEPRRECEIKTLPVKELGCYMRTHNQVRFGCATLPGCFIQRGKHLQILHTP